MAINELMNMRGTLRTWSLSHIDQPVIIIDKL